MTKIIFFKLSWNYHHQTNFLYLVRVQYQDLGAPWLWLSRQVIHYKPAGTQHRKILAYKTVLYSSMIAKDGKSIQSISAVRFKKKIDSQTPPNYLQGHYNINKFHIWYIGIWLVTHSNWFIGLNVMFLMFIFQFLGNSPPKRKKTKEDFFTFCSMILEYTQYDAVRQEVRVHLTVLAHLSRKTIDQWSN